MRRSRPYELLIFWTGLVALFASLSLPALAQGALQVKQLDTSHYPQLSVNVVAPEASRRPPTLREGARPVVGLEARNLGESKSVVLAVDRSMSMRGEALVQAVAAARAFVGSKPAGDRLAVVAFGSRAVLLSRFSSATIDADTALRTLAVDAVQGTALNDAIVLAGAELRAEPEGARVLVVLTDGTDQGSGVDDESAVAAAKRSGVTVYAIGVESAQFAPDALQKLAGATGGAYRGASSPDAISAAYAAVANDLRRTWRLSWLTAARPGERLELTAQAPGAGETTLETTLPGTPDARPTPPSTIVPEEAYESSWGPAALGLATGLLVLLAVALASAAKRGSWLRRRLAPHVESRAAAPGTPRERFAAGNALTTATERALGHLALWRKAHRLLERGDVPLKTAEFFYICLGAAFVAGLLVAVAGPPPLAILLGFAAGGAIPVGVVRLRARKRLTIFDNQLPDLLLTLAASLKAGHSFKQGLQTVVDEGMPPASEEFRRVLTDARLGRPMEEALGEMSERVGSKNLDFVITAVTVQAQVGGSLSGLFDMVAEAVRQRQQFARKVRSLTAEGRASAYLLVGLPFLLAGALTLIAPDFMDPLWHTGAGQMLVAAGLVMMTFGSLMVKRIVSFKG